VKTSSQRVPITALQYTKHPSPPTPSLHPNPKPSTPNPQPQPHPSHVFRLLNEYGVILDAILLKPNSESSITADRFGLWPDVRCAGTDFS